MAKLRDANGKIVIDSAEAAADIRNLKQARQALAEYQNKLTGARTTLRAVWTGRAFNAYNTKTNELVNDIGKAIDQIDLSIKSIEAAVARFQETDRALAARTNTHNA